VQNLGAAAFLHQVAKLEPYKQCKRFRFRPDDQLLTFLETL